MMSILAASASSRAAAAAAATATARRHVTSAATSSAAAGDDNAVSLVRTTARLSIPTFAPPPPRGGGSSLFKLSVPMSVVDVSLRSEQLPFAYFFANDLDTDSLTSSLRRVVRHFPLLGGKIELARGRSPRIVCRDGDSVDLFFGESDVPLAEWLDEDGCQRLRRHVNCSNGGHPALLPLFEPLFPPSDDLDLGDGVTSSAGWEEGTSSGRLATIRVTHLAGGGTALGVNLNHALADAASAVRFVRCWGREMRGKPYPGGGGVCPDNDRSRATTGGMVSPELSDLMGLGERMGEEDEGIAMPDFAYYYDRAAAFGDELRASLLWQVQPWDDRMLSGHRSAPLFEEFREAEMQLFEDEKLSADNDEPAERGIEHEYVHLPFPPEVLDAMKAHGMEECRRRHRRRLSSTKSKTSFVSTNDMVTAFGWLLKRRLSGRAEWGVSMVVNLRGRDGCDVDDFACMDAFGGSAGESKNGVFGNGIANVVAAMPPAAADRNVTAAIGEEEPARHPSDDRHSDGEGEGEGEGDPSIVEISAAARVVRRALTAGFLDMPDRVAASRIGRPSSGAADSDVGGGGSFGTTSWGQFPLWDVRFSSPSSAAATSAPEDEDEGRLVGFHGHPSHPLPVGRRTYSSVLVPRADGGVTYKLLLPRRESAEAEAIHLRTCASFLDWHDGYRRSSDVDRGSVGPQTT